MKKFKVFLAVAVLFSGCSSCSSDKDREDAVDGPEGYFNYSNPMYFQGVDNGRMLRDPCIVKEGDTYYLTGTAWPNFEEYGEVPGSNIYASEDLVNWRYVCTAVERPAEDGEEWWKYYFWAPELFIHNGKYYFTVNCSRKGPGDQLQEVALFVAEKVEGPYEPVTKDDSIIVGNDAHIFADTDGRTYMFVSGIRGFEVDLETGAIIGDVFHCVTPTPDQGKWTSSHATGLEGPYVVLREGTYYLFFSCWARGYEIGYATAANIRGPWTMHPYPIYGSMNKATCERLGTEYIEDYYANGFAEAGHNTVFPGPDGRDWIVAHVFAKSHAGHYLDNTVGMCIDPIEYRDGKIYVMYGERTVNGPTEGKRSVKIN